MTKDKQFVFTAQVGKPGHCHAAQIFKDGKAFLFIEPTENPGEATETARKISEFLNSEQSYKDLPDDCIKGYKLNFHFCSLYSKGSCKKCSDYDGTEF